MSWYICMFVLWFIMILLCPNHGCGLTVQFDLVNLETNWRSPGRQSSSVASGRQSCRSSTGTDRCTTVESAFEQLRTEEQSSKNCFCCVPILFFICLSTFPRSFPISFHISSHALEELLWSLESLRVAPCRSRGTIVHIILAILSLCSASQFVDGFDSDRFWSLWWFWFYMIFS